MRADSGKVDIKNFYDSKAPAGETCRRFSFASDTKYCVWSRGKIQYPEGTRGTGTRTYVFLPEGELKSLGIPGFSSKKVLAFFGGAGYTKTTIGVKWSNIA